MSMLKRAYRKTINLIPTQLPVGMEEFDKFCKELFETYGLPDLPSYRHAVSTMIMNLGPTTDKVAKKHFAKAIRKAMANQVAFENIQRLKKEEAEYNRKIVEEQESAAKASQEQDDSQEKTQDGSN